MEISIYVYTIWRYLSTFIQYGDIYLRLYNMEISSAFIQYGDIYLRLYKALTMF